ncbi:hypothetical protein PPERSA_09631 [Pseudocohnilembus persalinus]|uniref:Potassium channel domain-containing protein n=1 Tax=Pseudocohnilembus persalinus TaxID=266149 RepID=A0A0V0QFN9_PSEPJ|nr:hypothetical protein PPERSA_09631 [Pseudocohnilembus persalinus]|eukprot:KRX01025.1 hypothetical protein PPERSA_09631 [Pseudocohnilembus persalinus]
MVLLLIAHFLAIFFLYLATINTTENWIAKYTDENIGWLKKYNLALYWAIMTMTSVGYGDITPVSHNLNECSNDQQNNFHNSYQSRTTNNQNSIIQNNSLYKGKQRNLYKNYSQKLQNLNGNYQKNNQSGYSAVSKFSQNQIFGDEMNSTLQQKQQEQNLNLLFQQSLQKYQQNQSNNKQIIQLNRGCIKFSQTQIDLIKIGGFSHFYPKFNVRNIINQLKDKPMIRRPFAYHLFFRQKFYTKQIKKNCNNINQKKREVKNQKTKSDTNNYHEKIGKFNEIILKENKILLQEYKQKEKNFLYKRLHPQLTSLSGPFYDRQKSRSPGFSPRQNIFMYQQQSANINNNNDNTLFSYQTSNISQQINKTENNQYHQNKNNDYQNCESQLNYIDINQNQQDFVKENIILKKDKDDKINSISGNLGSIDSSRILLKDQILEQSAYEQKQVQNISTSINQKINQYELQEQIQQNQILSDTQDYQKYIELQKPNKQVQNQNMVQCQQPQIQENNQDTLEIISSSSQCSQEINDDQFKIQKINMVQKQDININQNNHKKNQKDQIQTKIKNKLQSNKIQKNADLNKM